MAELLAQVLIECHGIVVVDLPRAVRSLSDCIVPLIRHAPEGIRKDCPRSKLRGITS